MYISPSSLQDVCVNFICENLAELTDEVSQAKNTQGDNNGGDIKRGKSAKLAFKDKDVFLHSDIAEQLLRHLCVRKLLNDLTLTLFDPATTRLTHVSIPNASNLSKDGLKILKGHKITDLEACGLKFTVNDLVTCLGEWTLHNLRSLCVARSTFTDGSSRHCVMIALSKLKCLVSLDVSGTEFNRHALDIVVEDLPLLESLDISSTRVDDISPLRKCKNRLKHLVMYNLKFIIVPACEEVLLELSELRTLDVSEEKDHYVAEIFEPGGAMLVKFLQYPDSLPHLTYLDISGKGEVRRKELCSFLHTHKQLQYLGLVNLEICSDECFVNPKHPDFNSSLKVGGVATEEQLLLSLKRYVNRTIYVQKCLYNLFRLTQVFAEPRVDIVELVMNGMEQHPESCGVQMAATACLYNLTKGEMGIKIHPQVLGRVVDLCLSAMATFPGHYQLQKNTLLTLCSDRILQDVPINRFKCAKLVLDSLCAFEDASMNRMSVAICSILAAKISTNETSRLGSNNLYMHKLLRLVRSKKISRTVDITMKFTLSALWNLTDESPVTCGVFLDEGGLELFLEVLQTFPGEASVETKVLGLINNIAEVGSLRNCLLQTSFLTTLRGLLHSKQIDVSYFAAGIMAHLAAQGGPSWETCSIDRQVVLKELGEVVTNWEPPEGEMVAYRSFYPFISLLSCRDAPQVQLWAVWAIHHVCTKNPQRYCPMLDEEKGFILLQKLMDDPKMDTRVRDICGRIEYLLETYCPYN